MDVDRLDFARAVVIVAVVRRSEGDETNEKPVGFGNPWTVGFG
jgi:hypothetical protein